MSLHRLLAGLLLGIVPLAFCALALAHPDHDHGPAIAGTSGASHGAAGSAAAATESQGSSRGVVLVTSLTVFSLAVFVGFEVIAKVPPTLHTPLMSGSNAISGITVVGAMIAAGFSRLDVGSWLGFAAVVLANINVVGGFMVTHRMLRMFKRR